MKALTVRYMPPTASKGSGWKVQTIGFKPKTFPYDFDTREPERLAVEQYLAAYDLDWLNENYLHYARLPTEDAVFVLIPKEQV